MLNIAPNVTFNNVKWVQTDQTGVSVALATAWSPKLSVLDAVIDNILKTLNSEVTLFLTADVQLTLHLRAVVMVTGQCQTFFIHQTASFGSSIVIQCHILGCEGALELTYPTTQTTLTSSSREAATWGHLILVSHYPPAVLSTVFGWTYFLLSLFCRQTAG